MASSVPLRAHVARGPTTAPLRLQAVQVGAGHPEVQDLDLAVLGQPDVVRLDVPMQDTDGPRSALRDPVVGHVQGFGDLRDDAGDHPRRQTLIQQVPEVGPGDILHQHAEPTLDAYQVFRPDDAAMAQQRQHSRLVPKTLHHLLPRSPVGLEQLHRHHAAHPQRRAGFHQDDVPEGAAAQQTNRPETRARRPRGFRNDLGVLQATGEGVPPLQVDEVCEDGDRQPMVRGQQAQVHQGAVVGQVLDLLAINDRLHRPTLAGGDPLQILSEGILRLVTGQHGVERVLGAAPEAQRHLARGLGQVGMPPRTGQQPVHLL